MNREFLKSNQYDWHNDPRKLRVNKEIPIGRCFHCGRQFLNPSFGISFCRECDKAMSTCADGSEHDYDSFLNAKEARANRELREPIDFELEETLKRLDKEENFKLANNKPIFKSTGDPEEDERIAKLYDL